MPLPTKWYMALPKGFVAIAAASIPDALNHLAQSEKENVNLIDHPHIKKRKQVETELDKFI